MVGGRMLFGTFSYLAKPLLSLIMVTREPSNGLENSEAWIRNLEALMKDKHWHSRAIRDLGRKGIPDQLRSTAWKLILEVDKLPRYLSNYRESLQTYFGTALPDHFQAPCFGSSINLDQLELTDQQQSYLKGILCIIGSAHPNLEYTPLVPAMVASFLHYMGPDDVLGCMASLIKGHSIPAELKHEWAYFPLNRRDFLVFQRVFEDLAKRFLPKVRKHITKLQFKHSFYAPSWENLLSKMFIEIYPFWFVASIIDAYIIEGFKILLRFGLAHLQYRQQAILASKTPEELDYALLSFHSDLSFKEAEFIRSLAFRFSFSRKDILRYRSHNRKLSLEDFDSEDRILIFHRPLPLLKRPSEFFVETQWSSLWSWVPSRFRLLNLDRIFTTSEHGRSLNTFYSRCGQLEPLLILIRASTGEAFGAFVSKSFKNRSGITFYGTGETFLFSFWPKPSCYTWNPRSDSSAFICASDTFIALGAGKNGFGLRIDGDLAKATSNEAETFNNLRLFEPLKAMIDCLEVFSFV